MESLEFEARRDREPRDTTGAPRPIGHEPYLAGNPGVRPGGDPFGRQPRGPTGARQDDLGGTAPPRVPGPGGPAYISGPMVGLGGSGTRRPQRPPAQPASAAQPSTRPYGDGCDDGWNDSGYSNGAGTGRNGDSRALAARILSVADYQAASITQQASYQAAMIARQVAHQAKEIREAAAREAEQIRQHASLQAAAVREAAQIEAAEVHTAVMSMQTELSELAERIRTTFPHPALPPIEPAERLAGSPATSPSTRPRRQPQAAPPERPAGTPAAQPPGKAEGRPAGGPGRRSAKRPAAGRGRQVGAMRFAVIATSALFLVPVAAGIAEIHLHGFDFFVFRSVGTGETGPGGLQEDQGPGQPDAPKPILSRVKVRPSHVKVTPSHIKVRPSPHITVTVHKGQ